MKRKRGEERAGRGSIGQEEERPPPWEHSREWLGWCENKHKMEHEGVARDETRTERDPDYVGPCGLLRRLKTFSKFEAGKYGEIC